MRPKRDSTFRQCHDREIGCTVKSSTISHQSIRHNIKGMIELTRINGKKFMLNHNLIEIYESTPDTVIKLNDGTKYIVVEKPEEIRAKIVEFSRQIFIGRTETN